MQYSLEIRNGLTIKSPIHLALPETVLQGVGQGIAEIALNSFILLSLEFLCG
jgi:hypothetical protein